MKTLTQEHLRRRQRDFHAAALLKCSDTTASGVGWDRQGSPHFGSRSSDVNRAGSPARPQQLGWAVPRLTVLSRPQKVHFHSHGKKIPRKFLRIPNYIKKSQAIHISLGLESRQDGICGTVRAWGVRVTEGGHQTVRQHVAAESEGRAHQSVLLQSVFLKICHNENLS